MTQGEISVDADTADGLGERLFTMVVYTDTHLNQSETESMSPHEVNLLANARMRYVINEINTIAPEFVIHLGDLVHPVPVMPIYADAAERFHEQTSALDCRQYLVPGNHDVGDKPIKWGPAGVVCDDFLMLWEKHFGDHFYAFDHGDCHFVVVNAQIINSGLASEDAQREWLERDLAANAGKRLFVNIHYPPYLTTPDEAEHYDNIAEPGRSWVLNLLEKYRVEALFAGHVHNFWYNRHGDTHCYLLPSTAFVRQDYSEMFRIEPGPEAGRNDAPKLGYFVVHVHANGHVCHPVRTFGKTLAPDDPIPPTLQRLPLIHPRVNRRAAMGFDFRQPWTEIVEIPPSGGLDEFARKAVRNDYPLLSLWEMGVRRLRIPLHDLADPRVRQRMRDLKTMGHAFTVFSFELPDPEQRRALTDHGDLIEAWEVGFAWNDLDDICRGIRTIKDEAGIAVFLTKLRSKEDLETDGHKYYHVINHGFVPGERAVIRDILGDAVTGGLIDGFVFRVLNEQSPWAEIQAVGNLAANLDTSASVHVRLATSNPASESLDDALHANRIAEALVASVTQPNVRSFIDTFADIDRGYFVRNGVVDRRYNPRLGSHVVMNLYAALNEISGALGPGDRQELEAETIVIFSDPTALHVLVLPRGDMARQALVLPIDVAGQEGQARIANLVTGEIIQLPWSLKDNSVAIPLPPTMPLEGPALVSL